MQRAIISQWNECFLLCNPISLRLAHFEQDAQMDNHQLHRSVRTWHRAPLLIQITALTPILLQMFITIHSHQMNRLKDSFYLWPKYKHHCLDEDSPPHSQQLFLVSDRVKVLSHNFTHFTKDTSVYCPISKLRKECTQTSLNLSLSLCNAVHRT